MAKIGIFGGAFDPPHIAHINITKMAIEQIGLDMVYFVPAGNHPYKHSSITDSSHRLAMVNELIQNEDKIKVSTFEIDSGKLSYTHDTIKYFAEELCPGDRLYFIMGGDSLFDIENWHRISEFIDLCTFLVYERDGLDVFTKKDELNSEYGADIQIISGDMMDVSSSSIRDMIKKGDNLAGLLTEGVIEYINKNKLYGSAQRFRSPL